MPRIVLIALCFLLCASVPDLAQTQKPAKAHKTKPKVAQQPKQEPSPAPQPTPPPPTPEQGPSSPPDVNFQAGQLTIVARNSTMGDVLNAVKQKTGAAVEMPAVSSERVVGRFGPGAPRDVMAQLLNGSHYDYVLLGSPADPGALKKVVLMARASGPEPAPQQQQGTQQPNFQGNQNLQAVPEIESEQNPEENNAEVPQEVPQQEEEPQPDQQGQQNGPVVKTPEQLLRELQQQQQQQQQQQDVPPGAPGQPPQ